MTLLCFVHGTKLSRSMRLATIPQDTFRTVLNCDQYYHSIHARGEDVEEILRKADISENAKSKASATTNGKHVSVLASTETDDDYEDGEIEDEDMKQPLAPVEEYSEVVTKATDDASTEALGNENHANQSNTPTTGTYMTSQLTLHHAKTSHRHEPDA